MDRVTRNGPVGNSGLAAAKPPAFNSLPQLPEKGNGERNEEIRKGEEEETELDKRKKEITAGARKGSVREHWAKPERFVIAD